MAAIEALLEKTIGLDSTSVGSATVMRAVRRRMESCQIDNDDAYLELLNNSANELQELIDEVTVPETWFFRDLEPFRLLAEHVSQEWLTANDGRVLRVLSVPCSSGEEPYSIAMILSDIGLERGKFRIDAVDISARIVNRAKRGAYGRNSFRGDEGDARDRHFKKVDDSYELNEIIRGSVNFRCGNVLDDGFLFGSEIYDVIFCRNLLIYFDRSTQSKVLKKLHGLLTPTGLLFLGHAEGGCVDNTMFKFVRRSGAFAYHKTMPSKEYSSSYDSPLPVKARDVLNAQIKSPSRQAAIPRSNNVGALFTSDITTVRTEEDLIEEAKRHADHGNFALAGALCEDCLKNYSYSASAYYLLGVIREAEGNSILANELFHKAVYLDPKHHQALIHLAVHAEKQGDMKSGAGYRARVQRIMTVDKKQISVSSKS